MWIIFIFVRIENFITGSDVDIALKGEIDLNVVVRVSQILNEETRLPYHFDILDYQTIQNIELKEHIDRVGVVLYCR